MDFGDWNRFGIEACADQYLAHDPDALKSVCGRVRVWLDGKPTGSLDEWGVVLGLVESNLRHALHKDRRGWHPHLADLAPSERSFLADLVIFGVDPPAGYEHLKSLAEDEEVRDGLDEGYCLMHSNESFDGWKVIMLRKPGAQELLWRWAAEDRTAITCCTTTVNEVEEVLLQFSEWLAEAQAEWTARSPA